MCDSWDSQGSVGGSRNGDSTAQNRIFLFWPGHGYSLNPWQPCPPTSVPKPAAAYSTWHTVQRSTVSVLWTPHDCGVTTIRRHAAYPALSTRLVDAPCRKLPLPLPFPLAFPLPRDRFTIQALQNNVGVVLVLVLVSSGLHPLINKLAYNGSRAVRGVVVYSAILYYPFGFSGRYLTLFCRYPSPRVSARDDEVAVGGSFRRTSAPCGLSHAFSGISAPTVRLATRL